MCWRGLRRRPGPRTGRSVPRDGAGWRGRTGRTGNPGDVRWPRGSPNERPQRAKRRPISEAGTRGRP
eukprot:3011457-Lingulodinium_polyedra.AAC.1